MSYNEKSNLNNIDKNKIQLKILGILKLKKKTIKIMLYIIISLYVLSIFVGYYAVKIGYDLEYMRFYTNTFGLMTYVALFIIYILPMLISLIGISILQKINHQKPYINILTAILPAAVLGIFIVISSYSGLLLFSVAPPFESQTNSLENYLAVGDDVNRYERLYKNFFPEEIPNDASNISYYYRKYNGLFDGEAIICASWTLPIESYEYNKQLIKNKSKMKLIESNKYEIQLSDTIVSDKWPTELKLIFEYNDSKKELKYTALVKIN